MEDGAPAGRTAVRVGRSGTVLARPQTGNAGRQPPPKQVYNPSHGKHLRHGGHDRAIQRRLNAAATARLPSGGIVPIIRSPP
jgi:hypothetical protein